MAGGRVDIARVKGRGYSRSREPEVRINQRIRAREVRLIAGDGEQLGVLSIREALSMSEERGVDLVEVAPNANPPVCRLMDYGKYKYELKKQAAAKKQKSQVLKEIKFRPNIGDHDLDVKIGRIREFLGEDNKTKIRIFFRGREIVHPELGRKLANRILEKVADLGGVDIPPKMEGKNLIMVISPKKNTQGGTNDAKDQSENK
ncbi:MAG: translation initiation factor IF-3 [Deltaproteobacteria bacterium]|nr:translation initiation factor IF-3 [Deltaproteobacteria bacterium]MCK5710042.1 translation initiation factor IF-3 [Deltaproteobacteria bacterium]